MLTLDLALVTYHPEGIARLAAMNLPRVSGVRYVVSWQAHANAPVPDSLNRPDVEIHRFDTPGQSLNRNNAIEHCSADIILHADDDVTYTPQGLQAVIHSFETNPEVDVATFRSEQTVNKPYPEASVKLGTKLPRNYSVGTIEIAFRRSTAGHLRCCPEFGLNSPQLHGSEDEMFLMSAIRRGLHCRFFPVTICSHLHESTGTKSAFTNKNLQAAGCLIALTRPWTACLRIPLKAWRVSRKGQASFMRALYRISRGALMAPGVLNRNHSYLW